MEDRRTSNNRRPSKCGYEGHGLSKKEWVVGRECSGLTMGGTVGLQRGIRFEERRSGRGGQQ